MLCAARVSVPSERVVRMECGLGCVTGASVLTET